MSRTALLNRLAAFLTRLAGYPVNPAAVALAFALFWMW